MKYSKVQYTGTQWFEGCDESISCKSVRLVMKTKKVHECQLGLMDNKEHNIPIGSTALCEKGLLWEKWGSFYLCIPCMEAHLEEYCGLGPEDEISTKAANDG